MGVIEYIFRLSNRVLRRYPLCHSRPDRSLCYQGRYFGLCARCTGMYLSGSLMILSFPLRENLIDPIPSLVLGIILLPPGGIDGTTQMFGKRESTNIIRIITGVLLGIGVVALIEGIVFTLF